MAPGEIFDYGHREARLEQRVDHVATDETGASSDDRDELAHATAPSAPTTRTSIAVREREPFGAHKGARHPEARAPQPRMTRCPLARLRCEPRRVAGPWVLRSERAAPPRGRHPSRPARAVQR